MNVSKPFFTVLIFFASLLFSCSDRPSNVLKDKEMVSLMADMEIAEAYVNNQNNLTYQDREDIGKRVLASHGISEETLDTTLSWYGRNIDEYSQLFERVDKEIEKRRKKYNDEEDKIIRETDDLWPYSPHIVLSSLSGYDAVSFSIPGSDLEKGDVISFSFFLPNSAGLKTSLGVEYKDGFGETNFSNTSKNKVELELHTDSSKIVSRIFGTIHIKDEKNLPLYIDSITIKGTPIDTLNYRSKRRNQKIYGPYNMVKID